MNITKVCLVLGGVALFATPFFVQIEPFVFLVVAEVAVGGPSIFMIGKA